MVRIEFGPKIGRSGDSLVRVSAWSGLALNSDSTWSGWQVTTNGSSRDRMLICHTSPNRRRAARLKLIGHMPKVSVCTSRGAPPLAACGLGVPSSTGPAGLDGAADSGASGGGGSVRWSWYVSVPRRRQSTNSGAEATEGGSNRGERANRPLRRELRRVPRRPQPPSRSLAQIVDCERAPGPGCRGHAAVTVRSSSDW